MSCLLRVQGDKGDYELLKHQLTDPDIKVGDEFQYTLQIE